MKTLKFFVPLALLVAAALPAFPVSKEIVQLQTQVQALQDQMAQMKQSFDERMGVMQHLIERPPLRTGIRHGGSKRRAIEGLGAQRGPDLLQRAVMGLARGFGGGIAPEQRAAAFVRIGLCAVRANLLRDVFHEHQPGSRLDGHSTSSQKRSLRYFAPESANTVTMTARCFRGLRSASSRQPTSAAAALGLTSMPSSRANRFTSR